MADHPGACPYCSYVANASGAANPLLASHRAINAYGKPRQYGNLCAVSVMEHRRRTVASQAGKIFAPKNDFGIFAQPGPIPDVHNFLA